MIDQIIREDIERIVHPLSSEFLELSGKTILITGANGFIPSYFVDTLLLLNSTLLKKNPAFIILLTRHKILKNSRLGHCIGEDWITQIVGNVMDTYLPPGIDIIIHGASKASPKEYLNEMIETADINALGTKKLLEYSLNEEVSKFLFLGSGETYGDTNISPIPETYTGSVDPMGPRSAYQESKRFAETLCYLYHKVHSIDTRVARIFHTYGPRLNPDDGRVVSEFMRRAIINNDIEVVDNGALRTFSYISDTVEGIWRILLLGQPGQAYNIGSEEEISIKDLARSIIEITESHSKTVLISPQTIPHSIATPLRAIPLIDKIKGIGYTNKMPLNDGLKRLFRWYTNIT